LDNSSGSMCLPYTGVAQSFGGTQPMITHKLRKWCKCM